MSDRQLDIEVLKEFLSLPHRASAVLDRFAALPGAVRRSGGGSENFVYIPGTREEAVLLVAHADTFNPGGKAIVLEEEGDVIRNSDRSKILGADDRAGCAMLWLLRETGHGLLVTDGEEAGCRGAGFLCYGCPDLSEEINRRYQFMIQIDRRNGTDYKCYDVGTDEFRTYVKGKTGFADSGRRSRTDIVVLCDKICGVNLSCGYYDEHTPSEHIRKSEWLNTLAVLRKWLAEAELPKFERNCGE